MSDNVKNANQRLKILYLYKILLEQTDEEHSITMPEIIKRLESYGISAARKALYEDIEALRAFGLDVVSLKGGASGYFVANRDFELPELKLLADAVCSLRFLTVKKSNQLLKKIEGLSSVYEAKQIHRQVYVANRVKSMNERIYINVDVIHRAIAEGKQISFKYFDYNIEKKKKYRDGLRVCSPYAMTWDDERYYLIAFYEKYGGISNFRVDRMDGITILDAPIVKKPANFNIAEYMNSTFSMFSGEVREVKLRFKNDLVNIVFDRFGKDIFIVPDGDEHFIVRVNVKAEQPFFAWLFMFGTNAEIIAPEELKNRYREQLCGVLGNYKRGDNFEK
ncbi:MAG: WYL domain-containing protein [Ruminococcus sp.]|nr:WYL domain-containing protein [Ruminococcus sp.]MCM1381456.1 WYL domain-containing protein [Muribaculaceae bacterium]MCM1479674.1 WYL domain-containing protein [Muribaculaceae bacterium]